MSTSSQNSSHFDMASNTSRSSSSKGYLLHPNYPQHTFEPVFYIPQCPKITKVPEPKPTRKAPVAGYDMKTLRKQIEFLQTVGN